jgi:polyhydroxybutyrate depolymerase
MAAGLERTIWIYPTAAPSPPLAFVFHGRGGTAEGAAERIPLHRHWPQAVVAYLQGIPGGPSRFDPGGSRPSWQRLPGELEDRDVRFFDAALARLCEDCGCDRRRVFLLGQSNGGRFANLLWRMRGSSIAALCSAGSQGGRLIPESPPRPVFMVIGEKDRVAPREGQERSIALARALLGTDPATAASEGRMRSERGPGGLELVVYLHPGGHEFPRAALPEVAAFFARHTLPASAG